MAAPLPVRALTDEQKYELMASNLHKVGCTVKVLLADLHAFLDADKAPEGVLEFRAQYYERVIRALLRSVGVDLTNLEFVRGSSYQLTPAFSRDLLRLSKRVSIHDAIKASSEIVKSTGEPVMADGMYPMMQLLDEEYLDVNAEFGGLDQRKTFALANGAMPRLGLKVRAHLMNPMVPGLAEAICMKIAKAFCPPRETEGNGILAFIQHVLFPYWQVRSDDGTPVISVMLKDESEPTTFQSFTDLAAVYQADSLTPQLAKKIVEEGPVALTSSIRREFESDAEWQAVTREAYPDPTPKTKKKKNEVVVLVV
ncbi:Nucleotidylyl transferase [Mytilinidion resinicola]|uniref:tyrosine--tRNA ligase n=1 Tax=Mytilinidion resinicola TaxID=574789 RepID=A0A6A6YZ70_9PEZI|nr:Nucleotidylyl transferase [Mytilinidion resinicola]KAF2814236.1 Nucleotidylyl transferase [Mytilinidion resinicola]